MKIKRTRQAVGLSRGAMEVEHGIRPPMAMAVTLPITVDGKRDLRGLVVYVVQSAWNCDRVSETQLQQLARKVADAVNEAKITVDGISIHR